MRRKILILLIAMCIITWGAVIALLHFDGGAHVVVIPTLMVLPSLTPTATVTDTLTPSVTATTTPIPTLTQTPEIPTSTLATRAIAITAYMPGVYVPPTLTPIPFGMTILSAPPHPLEPLPDATLGAPPFAGWFSFESDNPAVGYFPAWEPRLSTDASRGQYHRTENLSSVARFLFDGEALRIRYVAAPNMGIFEVFVDGVRLAHIDAYAETLSFPGSDVFTVGAGSHVLELYPTGEKNPHSEGFTVGLDAIQVYRADANTLILPPAAPITPSPTPREAARVDLISAPPSPSPTATPLVPQPITVRLVIAYDENGNGTVDPAEGVNGISVRLVEAATNQVIASGFTDARGYADLTVIADSALRLVVPYFGQSWEVRGQGSNAFTLLIDPANQPGLIP